MRRTRNSELLNVPLFRSATVQRTFYHRKVSLWNALAAAKYHVKSIAFYHRIVSLWNALAAAKYHVKSIASRIYDEKKTSNGL